MISRSMLEGMFTDIAKQGQWNMAEPMLWGYFFTHHEPQILKKVVPILQQRDYEFVKLFKTEKDTEVLWWLHVQRAEVHSVDSLASRNEQLHEFAKEHGLGSYDGMDVGPLEVPEKLV